MRNDVEVLCWAGSLLVLAALTTGCGWEEERIKARANGVLAGIGGSKGHFAAESSAICGEMPTAETSIVPPLDKVCSRGCSCATDSNTDADPRTTYDCDLWRSREWQLIKFAGMYTLDGKVSSTVYVHHQASWHRTDRGCRLDFTVHGDLDGDGVYSTYATWTETTPEGAVGERPENSVLLE